MDIDKRDRIIAAIREAETARHNDARTMVQKIRRSVPDASLAEIFEVLQQHAVALSDSLDDVQLERLIETEVIELLESAGIGQEDSIDDFLSELGISGTGLRALARARVFHRLAWKPNK